eukprot:TRINITY_DN25078_c0_g1_i4.p3 TRINITY_DN25078_c0_g1~~TRINITY_DN25078_c0_g1_i4.p3  ORF type:complete len:133 (-),score=11.11 TRINITY_DN25078_c0_g1_i4:300-698(-)
MRGIRKLLCGVQGFDGSVLQISIYYSSLRHECRRDSQKKSFFDSEASPRRGIPFYQMEEIKMIAKHMEMVQTQLNGNCEVRGVEAEEISFDATSTPSSEGLVTVGFPEQRHSRRWNQGITPWGQSRSDLKRQ